MTATTELRPSADTAAASPTPGTAIVAAGSSRASARAFSFGQPDELLGGRGDLLAHLEVRRNDRWFEPPVPMRALARTYNMSPHHKSAILYKRNQLLRYFRPSRWLNRAEFGKFVVEFLTMGNAYLERRDNLAGRPLQLVCSPAVNTRRGVDDGVYWWVPGIQHETSFRPGYVFHLAEYDPNQEVYGLPEYLSALQSGLLNHDATIFRRKYYKNGSHAGFILYVTAPTFDDADAEELEEMMSGTTGRGNFKNLMLHLPGGAEKGIQVIPLGEATAKDEFLGIKGTTRDDILAAHRVPPVLIGVVPQVTGGFGKPGEAADVFHYAEVEPLMLRILEVNDWLGLDAIAFDEHRPMAAIGANATREGS